MVKLVSFIAIAAFFIQSSGVTAAKKPDFVADFAPSGDLLGGRVSVEYPGNKALGVLLLIADGRDRPSPLSTEKTWRDFAEKNDFAVAVVTYRCRRKKDASAIIELERLIKPALHDASVGALPQLLFGHGYGGSLTVRLVASDPRGILGWATLGTLDWVEPRNAKGIPPGLVACGESVQSGYEGGRKFVQSLRGKGARVAWTAISQLRKHHHEPTEQLVQKYFQALLERPKRSAGIVAFTSSKKETSSFRPDPLEQTSWLPDRETFVAWQAAHTPDKLIRETIETGVPEMPTITFALRLPTEGEGPFRVIAYCHHYMAASSILGNARKDDSFWNTFGRKRGLAVLTWNVGQLWKTKQSVYETDAWTAVDYKRIVDRVTVAWSKGIKLLAEKYPIKERDMMLYGTSRGANFSSRLVVSKPDNFAAVVIHNGTSFPEPNSRGIGTVWLLSNGRSDSGVSDARRFYRTGMAAEIPMVIKTFPGMGHLESEESTSLAVQFFDYFLKPNSPTPRTFSEALQSPQYVGDTENDLVFPIANRDAVPWQQQIPIPDLTIAQMWGRVVK